MHRYLFEKVLRHYYHYCRDYYFDILARFDNCPYTYKYEIATQLFKCSILDDQTVLTESDLKVDAIDIPPNANIRVLSVEGSRYNSANVRYKYEKTDIQFDANLFDHLFTTLGRKLCVELSLPHTPTPLAYYVDGKIVVVHQTNSEVTVETSDLFKLAKKYPGYRITNFEIVFNLKNFQEIMKTLDKFGKACDKEYTVIRQYQGGA